MERINNKLVAQQESLAKLKNSIELFHEYENLFEVAPIKKNKELYLGMRDSMIQRFEYCTDLFWKILKFYLETIEKLDVPINSPRGIIREAVKAKIISEDEGDDCMKMIECRNKTSHIYHEEMAEDIAKKIPNYYTLITMIVDRVQH